MMLFNRIFTYLRRSSKLVKHFTHLRAMTKGAAKVVNASDVSPAWKVLQMKLKEEQEEKLREEGEKIETDGFQLVSNKKNQKSRKRKAEEALQEVEASKKPIYDIPVLVKDNRIGEPTPIIALDCEYVGGENTIDILARVSIVNERGEIVYDKYVKPTQKVIDFRTAVSGVRPFHLKNGITFNIAQSEVSKILAGRIIVGHALHNDFKVLKLPYGQKFIRDTAKCSILRQACDSKKVPSLKKLAKDILGIEIQQGEHDSIIDARVALRLYESVKKKWEASLKRYRNK